LLKKVLGEDVLDMKLAVSAMLERIEEQAERL
jgi:hypothetical protein